MCHTISRRSPAGAAAKLLNKDEARRIAANIAKLPEPTERAANRPCVGHHQKYESVCLLQRRYRVDGAFLPKCSGSSSRPFDHPIIRASGAQTAAVPQVSTLELLPLCLRAIHCGLRTASVMRNE